MTSSVGCVGFVSFFVARQEIALQSAIASVILVERCGIVDGSGAVAGSRILGLALPCPTANWKSVKARCARTRSNVGAAFCRHRRHFSADDCLNALFAKRLRDQPGETTGAVRSSKVVKVRHQPGRSLRSGSDKCAAVRTESDLLGPSVGRPHQVLPGQSGTGVYAGNGSETGQLGAVRPTCTIGHFAQHL
jgi:hypothetical protein